MAEHDIEKIVEAGGDVFNFRDPTKQPVADRVTSIRAASSATDTKYPTEKAVAKAIEGRVPIYDNGSDVPNASTLMCLKISCPQTSGYNKAQVLLFDVTSFADGTINNNNGAYVGFSGFLIGGKPQGNGTKICVKICAKVSYTQLSSSNFFKTLQSDSSICGPEIVKRVENGVDKYYLSIFYESTLYTNDNILVGQFMWRKPTSIDDYSYSSGVIGISYPNQTYPANEPLWDRVYTWQSNVAALTSDKLSTARKLKTNLARTADSTFDGSADQTNIPVTGTLPVGNGGTGRTSVTSGNYVVGAGTSAMVEKTPKDVGSNVLSSLDDKSNASSYANFVDGDFVVGSDHVDASTISASTFVRRTALNLWNYIKSKLTGSDVNIGGNAATATKATQDSDGSAINTTYKKLAESSKFTEPQWIDNKTSSSYCDLRIGNSFKLLSVGVSGTGNIWIKEIADQRTNSPPQDKSIIYTYNGGTQYNFNGNAATATALADDSGYVHTTGNETVGGKKTFTDAEVNSESSSGTYSGFFVKRTAVDDGNKVYRLSLEVSNDGSRGIYDYGGSGLNGENKWILRKRPDGGIAIGESTNINKISIGGITLDFSGSLGNDANTLYFGWAGGGSS